MFQTVEQASEKATAKAFDRPYEAPFKKESVSQTVKLRVQDAHLYDAAYSEGYLLPCEQC